MTHDCSGHVCVCDCLHVCVWFCASSAVGLADESVLFRPLLAVDVFRQSCLRDCLFFTLVVPALIHLCFLSGPEGPAPPPLPPPLRSLPHLCPADLKPHRLSSSIFGTDQKRLSLESIGVSTRVCDGVSNPNQPCVGSKTEGLSSRNK